MGCKGCGKAKAEPKKTPADYLAEPATAVATAPTSPAKKVMPDETMGTDDLLPRMRVALCRKCEEKVLEADGTPTEQLLPGYWDGKLHCGNPNDPGTITEPKRFGWGGAIEDRAAEFDAVCPRKRWGPGRSFYNTVIPLIMPEKQETLPGVIDFIGPTRTVEGINDCAGIGDVMVQGVVAQAIQRFNEKRGLRVRFITVEGQVKWANMSCPGIEVLGLNSVERIPPGEFTQHSAPLRALEVDATCRMQGQNRHEFLAQQFGVPQEEVERWDIHLSDEAYAAADEFLAIPRKAGRPIVCVSPFANSPTRQWPLRHWVEVIDRLKKMKLAVFTLYRPPRQGEIDPLRNMPTRSFTSFDPYRVAAVIARSDIVIGNDSGMCHVAGILRKPSLSVCGPTDGNIVFGGWPTVRHIQAPGSCAGCLWFQDGGWQPWCGFGCGILADLKPSVVIPRVEGILREEGLL